MTTKSDKDECKTCGGRVYILGAAGSPLSGSHQWWGCCSQCREITRGSKKLFGIILMPAFDVIKKYSNYTVMRRYKAKSKEWFNKITEKIPPDEVIKEKKSGFSLEELIRELKKN